VQIEDVITSHPAILEAAAVAVPDEQFGEVVGAWVVRRPHARVTREEVRKSVGDNINPQVNIVLNSWLMEVSLRHI
jgi:acyl-CoA synthetase (AMP-forming)/AMP-acid ligase II